MSTWYQKNKEKHKANRKLYYLKNKEKELANVKAWKEANPDSQRDYVIKYQSENRDTINSFQREARARNPEKYREQVRKYQKNNKHISKANCAKRKATKLQQTPKWADLKAICEFYKNCPEGYHVDHIIPLQGKNVRGLHIVENLQYLPAVENIRKGNKFIL